MKKFVVFKVKQTAGLNPDNGDIVVGFNRGGFDALEATEYQTLEGVKADFAWLSQDGLSCLLKGGKVENEEWRNSTLITRGYKLVEINC